jgi:RNA polymerase sigma factor (TIGR02999 family)
MATDPDPIEEWRARGAAGNAATLDAAWTSLYGELKQAAHRQLRGSGAFQTTALVHEAWLKLAGNPELSPLNRQHLLAMSARAMRYVLVDHARNVQAAKRGNGQADLTLTAGAAVSMPEVEVLTLHLLLEELHQIDARAAQVVELRYFGGYDEAEVAAILQISESTLRRDWRRARAFLLAELET